MTKEEARLTLQEIFGYLSQEHPRILEALRVALNALSQPSFPSNLDSVAEEFGKRQGIELAPFAQKFFKAGAEWMAKQGWISVDESLPKMAQEVIVLTDEIGTAPIYKISFGHIVDVNRCIDYNGWNIPGVKYWMPCPKIPGMND